jgi:hypothetical protein
MWQLDMAAGAQELAENQTRRSTPPPEQPIDMPKTVTL